MFKKLFSKLSFETVGVILVLALGYSIDFIVDDLTKTKYLGTAVLSITYFYCSPMINPYINELRNKILKNTKKEGDK